ncbi:MAG: metallopeptidase family protein [Deltaproteobacteria bacterium]|nr:metallopeptidase family protein [Deltaproteobacteria bacterium]
MTLAEFEAVVTAAVAELPPPIRAALQNIAIVIEDRSCDDADLLGLYEGTPLPERTSTDLPDMPDKITLFRRNLEAMCSSVADLRAEIRTTLFHEIGHYFGLTEEQLAALGYE